MLFLRTDPTSGVDDSAEGAQCLYFQFILPAYNLRRSDAAHFQLAEIGQQFGTDNVILALPGALLCGVV